MSWDRKFRRENVHAWGISVIELDVESPWSTLVVTMPVNQHIYSFPLLQRLLERFPNMFPILRQLFDLE